MARPELLGPDGLPIPAGVGRERVPANLGRMIATVRNDVTTIYRHLGSFAGAITPTDETLRSRGKGFKLYDEVERDPHARAVLMKRKHELIAREWAVDPASGDERDTVVAAFVEAALRAIAFDRMCLELLDANLRGFSVVEVMWGLAGSAVIPIAFKAHDQDRFRFDADWRLRLLTPESTADGIPVVDRKFIVHRVGQRGSDPYGKGLGSTLFWWVAFKREDVAFWLTFLQKYATPTPIAKSPAGILPEQERKLLDGLVGLQQGGAAVIPMGSEVDFLEATRAAPSSYEQMARYIDEQVSEAVLGETLSTNIGKIGSEAAARVHAEQKSQVVDTDADMLSETLNETIVRWMTELNFPGANPPRVYRVRPQNDEDVGTARKAMAEAAEVEHRNLNSAIRMVQGMNPDRAIDVVQALAPFAERIPPDDLKVMIAAGPREPETAAQPSANGGDDDDEDDDPAAFAAPPEDVFATPLFPPALREALIPQIERDVADWLQTVERHIGQAGESLRAIEAIIDQAPEYPERAAGRLGESLMLAHHIGAASATLEAEELGLTREEMFPDEGAEFEAPNQTQFEGLGFTAAMSYLRRKIAWPTGRGERLTVDAHNRAFTVAGEVRREVLTEIREAVTASLRAPTGFRFFRERFAEIIRGGRWTADPSITTDPARVSARANIIWDTNLRTSHAAGRRDQQLRMTNVLPFWTYRHAATRTPQNPREAHMALDGLTRPATDEVWNRIYAPNGYRCSCAIQAVTRSMADRVAPGLRQLPSEDAIAAVVEEGWQGAPSVSLPGDRQAPSSQWRRR